MLTSAQTKDDFLHDWAADKIDELRQERDSLKAANDGWKTAFCTLHDALEKIAGGSFPNASTYAVNGQWQEAFNALQDIAQAALHTEEA